jgi:HEAT repeat protein
MQQLLRTFDQISFWIGFAAGGLFWWLLGRAVPAVKTWFARTREQARAARESRQLSGEYYYRNDLAKFTQSLHLAAPLFSLEEIAIEPRVLAPPPYTIPGEERYAVDSISSAIPYLPDFPEFASSYNAERLTLVECLGKGANLALIAQPGSGKTFALAHLASSLAQLKVEQEGVKYLVPFYFHAAEAQFPLPEDSPPFQPVLDFAQKFLSRRTASQIQQILETALAQDQLLLLYDGLDELAPIDQERHYRYLEKLMDQHPNLRMIAAVSSDYYGPITRLGLHPVVLGGWTSRERDQFIENWSQKWTSAIQTTIWGDTHADGIEATVLNRWLDLDTSILTPLERTLRVWAAYAGDALGADNLSSIEAYVRRTAVNISKADLALERLATQMITTQNTTPTQRAANNWSRGRYEDLPAEEEEEELLVDSEDPEAGPSGRVSRSVFSALLECGLLEPLPQSRVRLKHFSLAGYFAGRGLSNSGSLRLVASQGDWAGKSLAFQYLAVRADITRALEEVIDMDDPLQLALFSIGRGIRDIPKSRPTRHALLRKLVTVYQSNTAPLAIKARAMAAMAGSGDPGVVKLCKQMLTSPNPANRQLAALGLGYIQENKAVQDLSELMSDPSIAVRRAACLALVNIGTQDAIDHVAAVMLQGDEDTQRAAAEALANDPGDGHAMLREASEVEDLGVRRAAMYGLGRIAEDWVVPILQTSQINDEQWIVRNVATEVLNSLESGSDAVPRQYPPLHEVSWLLHYAAEVGEGLTPGEPARNMLIRAVEHGTIEQQLAGMDYVRTFPDEKVIATIYEFIFSGNEELRDAAQNTLWHFHAAGLEIKSKTSAIMG